MSKRLLLPLLLLVLTLILQAPEVSAQTFGASPYVSGDWIVTDDEDGAALLDYLGDETDLVLPEKIGDRPVTRLGRDLFMGNLRLRSVIIPSAVKKMENNIFSGCVSLEKVSLPYLITQIGSGTFKDCVSLKEISIPATVRSIGSFAFQNCASLVQVLLPKVSSIGDQAFENCTSLTLVSVSRNLSSVGPKAFRNTPWLERQPGEFVFTGRSVLIEYRGSGADVRVPTGTTMIAGAFEDHDEIETVFLPETVRNIGKNAFKNAVNLRSVNIPQYVTTIGESAFEGCRSLEEAAIPALVQSIGRAAFMGAEKITSVTIPEKVRTLPALAFSECDALREVYLSPFLEKFDAKTFLDSPNVVTRTAWRSGAQRSAAEHGVPNLSDFQILGDLALSRIEGGWQVERYLGCGDVVEIPRRVGTVPVVSIAPGAFQNNAAVRVVSLPASVASIGSWAFSDMENLEYISLPPGLKSVGDYVFQGSSRLVSVMLPRRLREISPLSFYSYDTVLCTPEDSYAAEYLTGIGFERIGTDCYRRGIEWEEE